MDYSAVDKHCYSSEHVERFMADNDKRIQLGAKGAKTFLKKVDQFFKAYGNPKVSDFNDLHFDLDCPIAYVSDDTRWSSAHAMTSPCLKDMEFYRVADPFTAFQELSMYISGVMGGRSPGVVDIGNDDRIAKHGFNEWSFRRESVKKPTRGKRE